MFYFVNEVSCACTDTNERLSLTKNKGVHVKGWRSEFLSFRIDTVSQALLSNKPPLH